MGAPSSAVERRPRWYRVAAAVLVAAVVALLARGLWFDGRPKPAELIWADVADRSVTLGVGSCNSDSHDVEVSETEGAVTIEVRSQGAAENEDCGDIVTVVLDRPVGDRAIVDGTTGEALVCGDTGATSPCRHLVAARADEE